MGALSSKVPKDLKNASVEVALQNTCYQSGETVNGYVDINISGGSIKCQHIVVEMKCETNTTVRYTKRTGSGDNRKTKVYTAKETSTNYHLRMIGSQFPTGRAEVGRYQIPFEFNIPPAAPSSVIVPLINRDSATITHMITVGIDVNGKTYYVHSVPFQVKSLVTHPIVSTMTEDKQDVNFLCCFNRGTIFLGAMLQKNAYHAGEMASITYEVDNNSSSLVEGVQVDLIATVSASAKSHRFVRTKVLASRNTNSIAPHSGFGSHRPENGPPQVLDIKIPHDCPYPSVDLPTLRINFLLRIRAVTATCVTDPTICLQLTVYQQHIQQATLVQGFVNEMESPDYYGAPMHTSVAYLPDSHALHGTLPPQSLRTPQPVPVDTTGDGIANAIGYDTTGDGNIDSLDCNGDGKVDMVLKRGNYNPQQQAPPSYEDSLQHSGPSYVR